MYLLGLLKRPAPRAQEGSTAHTRVSVEAGRGQGRGESPLSPGGLKARRSGGGGHTAGFSAPAFYFHGRWQGGWGWGRARRGDAPRFGGGLQGGGCPSSRPSSAAVSPHGAQQRGLGEPPAAGYSPAPAPARRYPLAFTPAPGSSELLEAGPAPGPLPFSCDGGRGGTVPNCAGLLPGWPRCRATPPHSPTPPPRPAPRFGKG